MVRQALLLHLALDAVHHLVDRRAVQISARLHQFDKREVRPVHLRETTRTTGTPRFSTAGAATEPSP